MKNKINFKKTNSRYIIVDNPGHNTHANIYLREELINYLEIYLCIATYFENNEDIISKYMFRKG